MSHSISDNNLFQGLMNSKPHSNDKEANGNTITPSRIESSGAEVDDKSQNKEDSSWTAVQSSNKTRRLVPQVSLTRQNLGTDANVRSKTSNTENNPRKKVIRFTKDELLNLRKSNTTILHSMAALTEFTIIEALEPVCFTVLDTEEVVRIWNNSNKDKENNNAGNNRGRGRGRARNNQDDNGTNEPKGDLWDDEPQDAAGDLANLAAAALNFRSSMNDMKGQDLDELLGVRLDKKDTMVVLLEEQKTSDNTAESTIRENNKQDLLFKKGNDSLLYTDSLTPAAAQVVDTPKPVDVNWYYTDPKQQVQGPFSQDIMRVWNEEGYFTGELPIRATGWTKFYPFRQIFPEQRKAFYYTPQEPIPVLPSFGLGHIQIHQNGVNITSGNSSITQNTVGSVNNQSTILPLGVRANGAAPITNSLGMTYNGNMSMGLAVNEDNSASKVSNQASSQKVSSQVQKLPEQVQHVEKVVAETQNKTATASLSKSDIAKQLLGIKSKDSGVAAAAVLKNNTTSNVAEIETKPHVNANSEVVEKSPVNQVSNTANTQTTVKSAEKSDAPVQKPLKSSVTLHETTTDSASSATLHKIPLVEKIVKEQQQLQQNQSAVNPPKSVPQQQQQPSKTWNTASNVAKISLTSIQKQEEDERIRKESTSDSTATTPNNQPANVLSVTLKSVLGLKSGGAATPAAAPWTAEQSSNNGLSLKEIMELEEQTQEQERKSRQQSSGVVGHSWAAKARSSAPDAVSPPVPANTNVAATTSVTTNVNTAVVGKTQPAPIQSQNSTIVPIASTNAVPTKKNQTNTVNNFGGKQMSKEMADWCTAQLRRINGSDDLTLMQFCMSLESAVDIREMFSQYLGSSVQVTNFATEFIKFKEEGKRPASLSTLDKTTVNANTAVPSQQSGFISATKKKKATK